jgi:hypothetical protein
MREEPIGARALAEFRRQYLRGSEQSFCPVNIEDDRLTRVGRIVDKNPLDSRREVRCAIKQCGSGCTFLY